MAVIKSGATTDTLTIDPTSNAARTALYDTAGNPITKTEKAVVAPASTVGLPIMGVERNAAKLARSMSDGSLADGRPTLAFNDPVEGAVLNTALWTSTATTMTADQAAATGIRLNAGAGVATTTGVMLTGQRLVPMTQRSKLAFRSKQRHTAHFNNNVIETGLINTTVNATTTLVAQGASGAFWQKDGTGQYIPNLIVAGSVTAGTPISNVTFLASVAATHYAVFEIELDTAGAWFRILTVAGTVVDEQRIDLPTTVGDWSVTHFAPLVREYNTGGTGTAVNVFITETTVHILDQNTGKPWSHIQSGYGLSAMQSPTAYTQATLYTNNGASATATPTNTSIATASLGGHFTWSNGANSFAASDTADWLLFSYLVPVPYTFYLTGVRIDTVNLGAANAAAPYTIEYSLALNSTTVTLATAAIPGPRFIPLGFSTLAASAAVGVPFTGAIDHGFNTPFAVQSGHYVQVVARVLAGSATASQTIRTVAAFDGYFE